MLRTSCILCVVLWVGVAQAQNEGFQNLFNGKDLTGWTGNPELWSVEEGAITGKTNGPDHLKYNQFLIWQGGTVSDFEFRCEFRLEGNNNSGVQYRSQQLKDAGDFVVKGYQADIHPSPAYLGMLYDERGRGIVAQRGQKVVVQPDGKKEVTALGIEVDAVDLTQWHELTVIAQGNRLIHKLDGVTVADITDQQESEREMEGILALQVHRGPAMKIQFRNLRLKDLSKTVSQATETPRERRRARNQQRQQQRVRPEVARPNWIWLKDGDQFANKVYFRKEIEIRGAVAAARLYATCDDRCTIYVDGQQVLSSDRWERIAFADIQKIFEKEGKHCIAVEGTNSRGPGGMLLQLVFESGWRDAWAEVSDESWQASTQAGPGWNEVGYDAKGWQAPQVIARLGEGSWARVTSETLEAASNLKTPEATPVERLKIAKDFHVELLYSVPKEVEGSWVSMCTDPQGRLIVCDQYGGLFRVTPPGINGASELQIEKINVDIGEAQGLLYAFDSLYVMVNKGGKYDSGLYRVRDTDGDDQFDSLETLRKLNGGGEHGPHAVLLAPDGESLYVVCGNNTKMTEHVASRVPEIYDEDLMIPRIYGRGFMRGTPPPAGYVARIDPDATEWEIVTVGFRNEYDAAFNADGELFTFDADMEWDINCPWYRPTRVCHVLSGVDYGWRNGSAKFPVYYPETLPPVVDIGPGSPTGIVFGYGAQFPAKYQKALFINDWSYGKLYAVHLQPAGATYTATFEEFITGTPLPLTDIVVNPVDGAMYFAIGGRRVQSGLYRVTYKGSESTAPVDARDQNGAQMRALRRQLEELHVGEHPHAVEKAWPYLSHEDRVIRYAARTAIEHRPREEWQERVFEEQDVQARLEGLLALVRSVERTSKKAGEAVDIELPDFKHLPEEEPWRNELRLRVLNALDGLQVDKLTPFQQFQAVRILQLACLRIGPPNQEQRDGILTAIESVVPAPSYELNNALLELLAYLQSEKAAEKGVALLEAAPTQEEQIAYAKSIRFLKVGWTDELRERYFSWFVKAAGYRGGANFTQFIGELRSDALKLLTEEQQLALAPILEKKPEGQVNPFSAEPRPFVKEWKLDELVALAETRLKGRNFDHGRKMFGAANCFACHRFGNEGGAMGPDLTGLAGRFSVRDILESIVDPSKVISDQYAAVEIFTIDGKVVVGRIVNLAGDAIRVNTNMLDPDAQASVDRKMIEEMRLSAVSMMPAGLLNTLNEEEVLDLLAYLLSRGDRSSPMFGNERAATQ